MDAADLACRPEQHHLYGAVATDGSWQEHLVGPMPFDYQAPATRRGLDWLVSFDHEPTEHELHRHRPADPTYAMSTKEPT